jgi:signal transduction histidine kinase
MRVWCVANDVTEIVDLNSRLLRDRERIKSYARQIISADERARRATAVDLHDGIAQTLVATQMMLKVLRDRPEGIPGLIDEVSTNVRSVQERTRTMISDLSPPGLYELGLVPALQWLAVHFRSHDQLHVQLTCRVEERNLPVELRILIFKLIRELLRNVVKHAHVDRAAVTVIEGDGRIDVEVQDEGVGFVWQLDLFGQRAGNFGLWSVAERVSEMGGELNVDTVPGGGARFALSFPLGREELRAVPAA